MTQLVEYNQEELCDYIGSQGLFQDFWGGGQE